MSKKTFEDSPAVMQFLSNIDEPVEEKETEYLTIREKQEKEKEAPEGYRLNPLYIEKKTRRVQLVFKPSLYEKVKKASEEAELSLNEYIHLVLEEYMRTGGGGR